MKRFWVILLMLIFTTTVQAQGSALEGIWLRGSNQTYSEFAFWKAVGCFFDGEGYNCEVDNGNLVEYTVDGYSRTPFKVEGDQLYFTDSTGKVLSVYIKGAYSFSCPAGTVDPRLLGTWFDGTDTIRFMEDGTAIYGKDTISYEAGGQLLKLSHSFWNSSNYAYGVHGNTFLTSMDDEVKVFHRADGKQAPTFGYAPGSIELIGRWVSYGEETVDEAIYNRDTTARRIITLDLWGNIEWYFPSLGKYLRGTFKYDGSHIYYHLPTNGDQSDTIVRMNHPITGAPLIILRGKAFVAAGEKEPW